MSCDWNNINTTNKPSGKHCIYASGAISNYRFSRLTLLNAGGGNAINRNDNGSNPGVSDNLIFSDIIIDNCRKALAIGHLTHNSVIRNVFATNIKKHGMDLNGIQNVTFTNCHFSGATENTYDAGFLIPSDYDYSASLENTYVRNVLIKDCTFTFKTSFLEIGLSRYRNCSGIRVENCSFKISNPAFDVEESLYPAYIKGIIQDIQFFGCRFETDGFYSVDHSRNGIFFYFDSGLSTSNVREMHWSFEKCAFINNGSVTVNSPILSRSSNDSTNSVYCTLVKCTFKGFRWLIRVATTKDEPTNANQRYYRKPGKINPYFYEDPTVDPPTPGMTEEEIVQNAVEALNNLKRFVSYKNLYLEPDSSGIIHYRNAETYGVQG